MPMTIQSLSVTKVTAWPWRAKTLVQPETTSAYISRLLKVVYGSQVRLTSSEGESCPPGLKTWPPARICYGCRCMVTIIAGTGKNVEKALCRWCREKWPLNDVSGLGQIKIPYAVPPEQSDRIPDDPTTHDLTRDVFLLSQDSLPSF